MQKLILIFIIIFIIYKINQQIEKFQVVGYNASDIPKYIIPNSYDIDTMNLKQIFQKISKDCDLDTTTYILYGNYIQFTLNNPIKEILSNILTDNLHDEIKINTDLTDIYWKDIDNDRVFIFNTNMINTHSTSRKLKIKILIKNIIEFTDDKQYYKKKPSQDYKSDINLIQLSNSIEVLCINLESDIYLNIGVDKLEIPFYRIKNTLSLMDPFITSGKDMIISKSMRNTFSMSLIEHQKKLDAYKKTLH